ELEEIVLIHVEALGQHFTHPGETQPFEPGLLTIILWHRGDVRSGYICRGDRIGHEGRAAGRLQLRLDPGLVVGPEPLAGNLVISVDGLVDVVANPAVDHAGRGPCPVEQHLESSHLLAGAANARYGEI